jgi:hypothetical protein
MICKFRGQNVDVVADIYGDYTPESEYGERDYYGIDVCGVFYQEVDIMPLLNEEELDELKEQLVEQIY